MVRSGDSAARTSWGQLFPRLVNNRKLSSQRCRRRSRPRENARRSVTRRTRFVGDRIRKFMSHRQILSGPGGKRRAPTHARKSRRTSRAFPTRGRNQRGRLLRTDLTRRSVDSWIFQPFPAANRNSVIPESREPATKRPGKLRTSKLDVTRSESPGETLMFRAVVISEPRASSSEILSHSRAGSSHHVETTIAESIRLSPEGRLTDLSPRAKQL